MNTVLLIEEIEDMLTKDMELIVRTNNVKETSGCSDGKFMVNLIEEKLAIPGDKFSGKSTKIIYNEYGDNLAEMLENTKNSLLKEKEENPCQIEL